MATASVTSGLPSMQTVPAAEAGLQCDVVIVNYNAGAWLVRAVRSVIGDAASVIVVDNGSADDSLARLEQSFGQDARLRIIRAGRNLGFSAGCNRGLAESASPLVLFLNPDCRMLPGSLARLKAVLDSEPGAGMVGGFLANPDGSEQLGGRREIPLPGKAFVRAFRLDRLWPGLASFELQTAPLPGAPVPVEAISGALMLVRRSVLDEIGGWDEGYFLHCEDLDLCMRIRQRGWRILFVPDAPVVHEKGACSRARPVFVEWHKHLGMMRFYRKFFRARYPGLLLWMVYGGVCLRFLAVIVWAQIRRVWSAA